MVKGKQNFIVHADLGLFKSLWIRVCPMKGYAVECLMTLMFHSHVVGGARRLNVAANGVAYAPPEARPGVVPRMLAEILGTRIMVWLSKQPFLYIFLSEAGISSANIEFKHLLFVLRLRVS